MPKGPCLLRAVSVPSSSFQRPWPRMRWRVRRFARCWPCSCWRRQASTWAQNDVISEINVSGNRRIPAETIRARIFTKPGDVYDAAALERDFNSLWNTGYFEDHQDLREQTPKGWRIIVQVKEKPTIREIDYVGLSSVSNSDVLDRFKQDKVGLGGGEPVRSHAAQESGSFHQEPAFRAWPAVRHDPHGSAADSSRRGRASRLWSRKGRRSKSAKSSSRATRASSRECCARR